MDDLKKLIIDQQPFTGLKISDARFDKSFVRDGNKMIAVPVIEVELECEDRKKPVRRSVSFTFCPFCGKEYQPSKTSESEVANA